MRSQTAVRLGAQRPRVELLPVAKTSAGIEAIDAAEACGLYLDDWQRYVLEGALLEGPLGKWAAFEVALLVSRQNGKGSILEARELAGLFFFDEWLILHSAHKFDTCKDAFERLSSLIEENPDFERRVKKRLQSNQATEIILDTGAKIKFLARHKGGGRGFSGDLVVLDEAMMLTDDHIAALLPTMSARATRGNPQIWYTSSAPFDESSVLHELRRQGRAGDVGVTPRLAYFEWSAPDDSDSDDREAWAQANPGLGLRLSEEFTEIERGRMSDEGFRRERLGIAKDVLAARVIPADDWAAVCSPSHTPTGQIAFGVDITPEREHGHAAIVACDEHGTIEVIDSRSGVGWLTDKVVELAQKHKGVVAVDSGSPAHSFADEWERAGVTVQRLGSREMAGACGTFLDSVILHTVQIRTDRALDNAAAGARKRESSDVWYWMRKDFDTDVSPLIAASIARWVAVGVDGPSVYEERGMRVLG